VSTSNLWLRPFAQRARRAHVRQPACSAALSRPFLGCVLSPLPFSRSPRPHASIHSGPTTVLVLSLLFIAIAFVVLLHIWGKFRKG